MKALIEEFNDKLKALLEELRGKKSELEVSLADVQDKIDIKIDEAKRYKVEVDSAKSEISRIEAEISSLENDLAELTSRFSNKNLEAILEAGNKEINAQIMDKQRDIEKYRERINEFTEKARTIKDLLISLKRDKETKKSKLANLDGAYRYYSDELNRIMTFALENPADLEREEVEEVEEDYEEEREVVDDKPIFDEIASIDKEKEEVEEEPIPFVPIEETEKVEEAPTEDEPVKIELNDAEIDAFTTEDALNPDHVHEEDLYKTETDITKLFATDSKDSFDSFDIKALSDSIDREYANVFGDSKEIQLVDNDDDFNKPENLNNNIFDAEPVEAPAEEVVEETPVEEPQTEEAPAVEPIPEEAVVETPIQEENPFEGLNAEGSASEEINFFGNTEPVEAPVEEVKEEVQDNTELVNFFASNNLDFNKFSKDEQEKLLKYFNKTNYTKTLDILRKNNINLDYLYGAADVFKIIHSELESLINKLLVAGQSTANVSAVLNALPFINSFDLQDVIDSYGPQIKDANITDLITKAKHLKELGGA